VGLSMVVSSAAATAPRAATEQEAAGEPVEVSAEVPGRVGPESPAAAILRGLAAARASAPGCGGAPSAAPSGPARAESGSAAAGAARGAAAAPVAGP